ncbi:MAG TPA: hypothetical protein VMV71_00840 [Candidatus Paceibacterota bacterium]|nr:hypothetical protein [Candidatus Paceibacterota bacterium]
MAKVLSFIKSKKFVFTVAALIVLLLVFRLGMSFGYNRALFGAEWGQNYYKNFYGSKSPVSPVSGITDKGFLGMHGTVGTIIDLTSSTMSVKGQDNVERSVAIDGDEAIRKGSAEISVADLRIGDNVAVIGGPNENGQIEARFIRVFPQQAATSSNIKN